MANISKHNTKQEGESNSSKYTWINFFVSWDTISIYYLLEYTCELIHSKQTRWSDSMIINNFECRYFYILIFFLNIFDVL